MCFAGRLNCEESYSVQNVGERLTSVALEHDARIQSDCIFCQLLSQTGEDSLERLGVATQTCHTESLSVIHKKRQGFPSNQWARGPPSA